MTATARIAPLEAPFPPPIADLLQSMMPPGVPPIALFRLFAKNERIARKVQASNLLDRGSLERREREIVILRTTARCGSEYEWGVHVATFAHRFGLTPEQVSASTREGAAHAAWGERDRLLIELVDALHDHQSLSDALYAALAQQFSEEQLIELVVLCGFYHMIAFVTNAFEIAREPGTPGFPRVG